VTYVPLTQVSADPTSKMGKNKSDKSDKAKKPRKAKGWAMQHKVFDIGKNSSYPL
jgi:hypothetical protein